MEFAKLVIPSPFTLLEGLCKTLRVLLLAGLVVFMLLLVNLSQMATLLFLLPFSLQFFRQANRKILESFWRFWLYYVREVLQFPITLSGDRPLPQENVLLLANHQSGLDILMVAHLANTVGASGDLKFLAKDILKYVPLLGLGMKLSGCLFLKRNWTKDQKTIQQSFAKILQQKTPLWLTTYPEGTRLTPPKLEHSQKYAKEQGFFTPHHVLIPRTKGVAACIQGLRPHLDAVYDATIIYSPQIPSVWDWMWGIPSRVHIHLQRFPLKTLPTTDAQALGEWTLDLFAHKDQRLAQPEKYFAHPPRKKDP